MKVYRVIVNKIEMFFSSREKAEQVKCNAIDYYRIDEIDVY